jgi:hypothetical protein
VHRVDWMTAQCLDSTLNATSNATSIPVIFTLMGEGGRCR